MKGIEVDEREFSKVLGLQLLRPDSPVNATAKTEFPAALTGGAEKAREDWRGATQGGTVQRRGWMADPPT